MTRPIICPTLVGRAGYLATLQLLIEQAKQGEGYGLHLSTQSPVLLLIEDVHWSDDTSLDFLHYLTRRSTSQPILLLATYRHDEMRPELRSWFAQLNRERLTQEMRLVPLSHNDVDTMLSPMLPYQFTESRDDYDKRIEIDVCPSTSR